jgi:S-adenosylmethionine hydrolase
VEGRVIHVDRFGNLVTSIDAEAVERLSRGAPALTVEIAGRRMPMVRTYGDLAARGAGALMGAHGRLEIAVREGSAAARLRARPGTRVRLSRSTASRARGRTGR